MLTIAFGKADRDCQRLRRRDFINIGTLAFGSLTLPQLLATKGFCASQPDFLRDKSVVLLYLSGGASHIETFDPKMTAPDGIRSVNGEVSTSIPGITFGGTFPQLAKHANKMAVVRSFSHPIGGHEQAHVHVLSGGTDPQGNQAAGQSIGSVFARIRGGNHPDNGLPTYALLTEQEIDGQYSKELNRVKKGSWPGQIGAAYNPFEHQVGWQNEQENSSTQTSRKKSSRNKLSNPLAANMQLNLPPGQLDNRMALLRSVDRLRHQMDAHGGMGAIDKFNAQAMDLVLGGAVEAFDLDHEDPKLVQKYDTNHIQIGFKKFRPSTLGKQLLAARRLCESGCGFVTVHSAGWDMHADSNNPNMEVGMSMLGRSLDQAVSAFIEDIHQRGLDKKILLVITGDFGRTPKVNGKGGRDHWAKLGTLAFAGGGLNMGQVIGQSARGADVPATEPIDASNLMGTIMHTLFDVGQLRLRQDMPRQLIQLIENQKPINQLFS